MNDFELYVNILIHKKKKKKGTECTFLGCQCQIASPLLKEKANTSASRCFIQQTIHACSCFRCLLGPLLHPPLHHRHPSLLPGAGCGSEDPTREHRSLELRLSQSGRDRNVQSDGRTGKALTPLVCQQLLIHPSISNICEVRLERCFVIGPSWAC